MGHTILRDRCPFCAQLKKEWYQHLENQGFEDAERQECPVLSNLHQVRYQEAAIFSSKFSYYQWAREKLTRDQFRSETDRIIWESHTEGLSRREIAPRIGLNDRWVGRKIQTIEGYLKDKVFTIASASYATA
jgi:thioredoxin-related protein